MKLHLWSLKPVWDGGRTLRGVISAQAKAAGVGLMRQFTERHYCSVSFIGWITSWVGEEGDLLEQPSLMCRLQLRVCTANVSGCFLRSEVCCFSIGPFSSAKGINESIPETCQQIHIPHHFLNLLAESHLWDEEPSAIHTIPGLWVCSQPMTMQARARAGATPSSDGMFKCGHANGEIEPPCVPVCPWAWKSDSTALMSQSCCVGKASESMTSGKELKWFALSIEAKISGGWNNGFTGLQ